MQTLKNSLTEQEGRVTNLNLQLEETDDHLQKTPQDLYVEQKHSPELKSKMETLQQTATKRVQMLEALSGMEWEQHAQCRLLKETLDSVTREVSHKHTQIISHNVNLGSQKNIDAESARELQLLKQQRSEDLEPDIEEMKAGDKLRVQELEIDRASMKPKVSNANCVKQVAEEQYRTLQTESKQLEHEILKEKTSVRQITAEKGELEQYLKKSTKEHNALIQKKNKVKDELIKLKNKLHAILHKHEGEAHKQHDNFEIKYSALTSEDRQMASELDGPRLLLGGKENVMGLQQDKLKRHSVETDFSNRKVELIHTNSTANGESKARMISELIFRNREVFSKKNVNQFPTGENTRLQLEMKYLEKELERKRQNNDKRKTETIEDSRKVKISELKHMSIQKEDKNITLASAEAELRNANHKSDNYTYRGHSADESTDPNSERRKK